MDIILSYRGNNSVYDLIETLKADGKCQVEDTIIEAKSAEFGAWGDIIVTGIQLAQLVIILHQYLKERKAEKNPLLSSVEINVKGNNNIIHVGDNRQEITEKLQYSESP